MRSLVLIIVLGMATLFTGCKKESVKPSWTYGEPSYYDEAGMPRWENYPEIKLVPSAAAPNSSSDDVIQYFYNQNDYELVMEQVFGCQCYDDDDDNKGFFHNLFDKDDDDDHGCECCEHHGMHDDDHDDYDDDHDEYNCNNTKNVNLTKLSGMNIKSGNYKVEVLVK